MSTSSTPTSLVNPMTTLGDVTYGGSSGAVNRLAGNTTATPLILTSTGNGSTATAPSWASIPPPFKNRLINGDFRINQRAVTSIPTGTATSNTYCLDRWYAFTTGAAVAVAQATNPGQGFQYAMQFTGAASNTALAFGQKIESTNIYDLAGSSTVTVSFYVAASALTTITCTAYTASGGVDTWTSRSAISGGAYSPTITSTLTRYSYSFTMSSDTNGVSIEFTTGAFTSGTVTITGVQLEIGSTATTFERIPITTELQLCQRYYYAYGGVASSFEVAGYASTGIALATNLTFPSTMRIAPTYAVVGTLTLTSLASPTVTTCTTGVNFTFFGSSGSPSNTAAALAGSSYLTFSSEL